MSKKKSKQLPITEVELTPEQIAQAKEILAGLQRIFNTLQPKSTSFA